MRILKNLFIGLFVIALASCSSDDDNGNGEQDGSIVGTWDVTQFIMEGNFTEEGMNVSFYGEANDMAGNDVTFKSDNTLTSNSAPFNINLTYNIDGMPPFDVTQEVSETFASSGTWRVEGNMLYISETGSDDEQGYNIETLTASTLTITADENNTDVGDDFPPGARFEVKITMTRR